MRQKALGAAAISKQALKSNTSCQGEGEVTRVLLLALGAKRTDQTAAASWAASLAVELTAAHIKH